MSRSPIIDEIRKYREEYAARHNYDIDKMCEDVRSRLQQSGRKVVSRKPRPAGKPKTRSAA
ncbi:MAG: hypothetical protein BECKG1743D_GA0114223_101046 [Candidatus Kentron sp. G]|nr:MAG: hypothetical protein BECKG1743D_GA0114223_101046 [Candidatus Kentron sp. G]VFM99499.1 MAG: hypothetical protein BECKG1743F_GA0114225_104036 [Candidatus Kentron sp. G]VFN01119.1 MAG: hypothetical protein BECKG1743E_GA0114224_103833 [Candidatus Kentron sp. G]